LRYGRVGVLNLHPFCNSSRDVSMATNFGTKSAKLAYLTSPHLTFVLATGNPKLIEYRNANKRVNSDDNSPTSCRNLVNCDQCRR